MTTFSTRAYLLAALLGAAQLAVGQAAPLQYPSTARSDAWMDSARRLPLPQQLAAVKARVVRDTLLRHPSQSVCFMPFSAAQRQAYDLAQQPRAQAELARPAGLLLLYQVDDYILTSNYPAQTAAFLQQIDAKHIQHITYLPSGSAATVLYGTRGANGVVLLSSEKPKRR